MSRQLKDCCEVLPAKLLLLCWGVCICAADPMTALATKPIELPVWNGPAPDSEQIDEEEAVVDRGEGKGYVDRSYSNIHVPTITVHLPAGQADRPYPAFVICPGGGFTRVVADKEGHDFAKFLNGLGVAGIVLKYRTVSSAKHYYGIEAPKADVLRAIRLTRANADKWQIDPHCVGVFGFSAGGHIASIAATHFDGGNPAADDPINRISSRPDFVGLGYPLISMQSEVVGNRYPQLLLGKNPSQAKRDEFSNELRVTAATPPVFLCHARDDSGVKVENSLRFAAACKQVDVPCTVFIRDTGGHGYGIRDEGKPINEWRHAFAKWLKANVLKK